MVCEILFRPATRLERNVTKIGGRSYRLCVIVAVEHAEHIGNSAENKRDIYDTAIHAAICGIR